MFRTACATVALLALANPAFAAGGCATPTDASALKTAVMQQELMVAAFQCRETSAYNRFVTTFRGELQSSDAALKAFFIRRGGEHGEASYDSFKTKAANLSGLAQARNSAAFCADAHALYTAAFAHQGSLMSFVESRTAATDIGNICVESRPTAPVLAKADTRPQKAAQALMADVGVPAHSVPAMPYRRNAVAPAQAAEEMRDDEADDLAYAEEALPPPRPRYYDIRGREYGGYPPRAYGPPSNWRGPRYGWYPRDAYGR
ncbi:MAG: hypothetical protein ABI608_00925 [Rhizomicrobium sp.]